MGRISKAEEILYKYGFCAIGLKVERQIKIGKYQVDFLYKNKIIVEVEGPYLRNPERIRYFESLGYLVLRFPDYTVREDPRGCAEIVKNEASKIFQQQEPKSFIACKKKNLKL